MTVLAADWPAPPNIKAFTTLRSGGVSEGPYSSLNLGAHVGDDPEAVAQNRALVREGQGWSEPLWLNQVHGTHVVQAENVNSGVVPQADGSVTRRAGQPLVVMTADCLPVLACDAEGSVVGAFHAGWKGLLAGVLEVGLAALKRPHRELLVWIGPAIGAASYQVGDEVREAYLGYHSEHVAEFVADGEHHWRFDLAGAAARRLAHAGVESITVSRWDTWADADLFFSHRRQAPCGRMGTFICRETRRNL